MKKAKSIAVTITGTMLTGMAISIFLEPNDIVSGGVSGIAILLHTFLKIPLSLLFAAINILLLFIGLKILGKEFIVKTLLGIGMISLFVQIFSYVPPFTNNSVIASIFGGCIYGLGIGMALAAGASTGGTDILGRVLQHFLPAFPIGRLIMVVDGAIVLCSIFVFPNADSVFFGLIAMAISTFTIDYLISTMNVSRIAFVISEKGKEISNKIINTSPRGVTMIDAIGGYTDERKKLLFCAMKKKETPGFQKKIEEIDPNAFIVFAEAQQILGNGFYIYR